MRLRLLLLSSLLCSPGSAAHADTITTDHFLLTYTVYGVTQEPFTGPGTIQQLNWSVIDGTESSTPLISPNDTGYEYGFSLNTVFYSGSDQTGTPSPGVLSGDGRNNNSYIPNGVVRFNTLGSNIQTVTNVTSGVNGLMGAVSFYPGTTNFLIGDAIIGGAIVVLSDVSLVVTQTTQGTPDPTPMPTPPPPMPVPVTPVAMTPEPSSLALLGTGVLGVAGLARRRFAS